MLSLIRVKTWFTHCHLLNVPGVISLGLASCLWLLLTLWVFLTLVCFNLLAAPEGRSRCSLPHLGRMHQSALSLPPLLSKPSIVLF